MNTATAKTEKIRCDACPVMCYVANGRSGACDRYANEGGNLIRLDPLIVVERIEGRSTTVEMQCDVAQEDGQRSGENERNETPIRTHGDIDL